MDEGAGPVRVQPQRTQRNQGTVGRQEPQPEPLTGARLADFVPRDGGLEREGSHPGADERGQRGATAQRGPHARGERAHVGALAAADADDEVRERDRLEPDRVHDDLARLALHLDPLPGELVEALAVTVERGVHGRHLLDAADERHERGLERGRVERGHRARLEHRAREILGLGGDAQADGGHVLLVEIHQVRRQLGRFPDQDGKDAGGGGIERAAVPDAWRPEHPAQVGHYLERRDARPLLDREDAGAVAVAHDAWPSRACLTAASNVAFADASGPGSVQPAAFSWPPPSNRCAMRLTGTSPLPRRLAFTRPSASARRSTATLTPAMERG